MIIQLFVPYLLAVRKTEEWMISQMSFSGAILWINIFSSVLLVPVYEEIVFRGCLFKEGANKRGNTSRLTQSFHFFMFEPIFSPVNALNQPI